MNDGSSWLIDTRGGIKSVPLRLVNEKKEEGWVVVPLNLMSEDGKPKQDYFPQYDSDNANFNPRAKETAVIDGIYETLTVEQF